MAAESLQDIPDHISLWGLLLAMRGPMQLFANVRPVRCLPSVPARILGTTPEDLDWVFVRENSEGEYSGHGGRSHVGHDWEVATEVSIYTRHAIRRIMRVAFEIAALRSQKRVTVVTKSNALRYGLVLWDEVAAEVARQFPAVAWDKELVDAVTIRMVTRPASLDVIVGTNLHVDILSDLAAALAGSVGVAPSSNLDPTRKYPSMFEPVHGSAFDITGKGVANPIGAIWSAAEMMRWVGEDEAAGSIMSAVEAVCRKGIFTADMGGKAVTEDITKAVIGEITASVDPERKYHVE